MHQPAITARPPKYDLSRLAIFGGPIDGLGPRMRAASREAARQHCEHVRAFRAAKLEG